MVIIYYLILKPLSYLPFRVLYLISDGLYLVLYKIIGYRKRIVFKNLKNAFPEKPQSELSQIASGYYHHFCDLIVESIKIFSISKEEATRRCTVRNPERWQALYDQGRNLVLVGGHYNNWELMAVSIAPQVPHQIFGLNRTFQNRFMDHKVNQSRGKFGMILHPARKAREVYERTHHQPFGAIFGADQSPSTAKKVYWMPFLNQETAVYYGVEKIAKAYNAPVIFGSIHKVKRGYYEVTYEVLEADPANSPYGKITQQHTRCLEKQILEDPTKWIWSHNRWKMKRKQKDPLHKLLDEL